MLSRLIATSYRLNILSTIDPRFREGKERTLRPNPCTDARMFESHTNTINQAQTRCPRLTPAFVQYSQRNMKLSSALLAYLTASAASSLAQSINIGAPVEWTAVTQGSTLTVRVDKPVSNAHRARSATTALFSLILIYAVDHGQLGRSWHRHRTSSLRERSMRDQPGRGQFH